MSAAAKKVRPPTFVTYTEVEVDISPRDLEAEGWVYVGDGSPARSVWVVLVRRTHDLEHDGPMRWCPSELCRAVVDSE